MPQSPDDQKSLARNIIGKAKAIHAELDQLDLPYRVATINAIRRSLHQHSPFADDPLDCLQWIHRTRVDPARHTVLAESSEAHDFVPVLIASTAPERQPRSYHHYLDWEDARAGMWARDLT